MEGVYANLEVHQGGRYRLRRRGNRVEAELVSTSSAVQHAARQSPQVLFTLPPAFRPPFPVLRRVVGQPVLADGSPDPASPDPRPFRLQIAPDGAVRYLDHPDVAELGYLAYSLHLSWGTTAAANDLAVLQLLPEFARDASWRVLRFEAGRLTALEHGPYYSGGEIPPELGELSQLRHLELRSSRLSPNADDFLTGPIPPEIGQLTNLTYLDLSGNQLTGEIPPQLGLLQHLTVLDLDWNRLTGAIPPALGLLGNLEILDLSRNPLTGGVPPQLGQLTPPDRSGTGLQPADRCDPA